MQAFLRYYLHDNWMKSVTTFDLRRSWGTWVELSYPQSQVNRILASVLWDRWLYVTEIPPYHFDFETPEGKEAENLALAYLNNTDVNTIDYSTFGVLQKTIFLEFLTQGNPTL